MPPIFDGWFLTYQEFIFTNNLRMPVYINHHGEKIYSSRGLHNLAKILGLGLMAFGSAISIKELSDIVDSALQNNFDEKALYALFGVGTVYLGIKMVSVSSGRLSRIKSLEKYLGRELTSEDYQRYTL